MGVISVLRAGVRGCGCFCAAIGSGWAVRGDAGNCGYGCRPVCGWAWSLLLLLSCVAFWGGQCAFFGEIARKSRNFQQKPFFRRKSGGIGVEMRRGGRVVARGDGKSWTPSLFCAQAHMVAAKCISGSRCSVFWCGRVRVCSAIFSAKLLEKSKISAKAGIFGGNRAGLGRKCAVGGWVTAQRYGKLRVRLSFCAQVCAAAVAFALQLGAAGRYAEMREIVGMAVGLYVGGHGRCFCF